MPTSGPLCQADIRRFHTDGFVRLERAFDRATAAAGCAILYEQIRAQHPAFDPGDRSTFPGPSIRRGGSGAEPFRIAAHTPRLEATFDQLVGVGRWTPRTGLGTFPIRFPHTTPPDDAGWHIDGSFIGPDGGYWVNAQSRGRRLLMLFLFTDVTIDDAPTRIRVGSHRAIPELLEAAGDAGLPSGPIAARVPDLDAYPIAYATGNAGDVYLCHPFLVHAADRHRGSAPRVIAQPELAPRD